ncbi:hypothetical protein IB286_11650 [Spongiibacter sp. KMU-158]|uniref:Uncharacterized protein n=1 Tax=Spongiibacter pelagi TaxID=2760804 RepID=A0A927C3T9_9GAMM|nr:hypothetical protein [Spongiibacter pelagi]MBD2859658.1 hypothetical protein [Spongiibacter pelagi]
MKLHSYKYTAEGEKYSRYQVKCTTRAIPVVSRAPDEKTWCVESRTGGQCFDNKIEAARSACEASLDGASQVLLANEGRF